MQQTGGLPTMRLTMEKPQRREFPGATRLPYQYYAYGLTLASQFQLPELQTAPPLLAPDAEIVDAPISRNLKGAKVTAPWLQCAKDRCQFSLEGVARFRIEQGRRIKVDRCVQTSPAAPAPEEDLRLYLLGTALGALLHQRHWLPLHVSAVDTPSGVWGFTGQSGAGKSTLAAWLHYSQGWPLVSDDVAVIRPDDELPYLHPGPARLKLWKDSLLSLGIDHRDLVRDQIRTDKFHLLHHGGFQDVAHPMRHLVVLERGNKGEPARLEALEGLEAFKAIMATVYRPELGLAFNDPGYLMASAADLASRIRVYRYHRPWSLTQMAQSLAPLLAHIRAGGRDDA